MRKWGLHLPKHTPEESPEEPRSKGKAEVRLLLIQTEVLHFYLAMICICEWKCSVELMPNGVKKL